jgi:hypothetical protein
MIGFARWTAPNSLPASRLTRPTACFTPTARARSASGTPVASGSSVSARKRPWANRSTSSSRPTCARGIGRARTRPCAPASRATAPAIFSRCRRCARTARASRWSSPSSPFATAPAACRAWAPSCATSPNASRNSKPCAKRLPPDRQDCHPGRRAAAIRDPGATIARLLVALGTGARASRSAGMTMASVSRNKAPDGAARGSSPRSWKNRPRSASRRGSPTAGRGGWRGRRDRAR